VSGPVLDRLDLQIEVPALTSDELLSAGVGESSAVVLPSDVITKAQPAISGNLASVSRAALSVAVNPTVNAPVVQVGAGHTIVRNRCQLGSVQSKLKLVEEQ
jgi:hypothetical protein